ncbi:hypothetical protein ACIBCS_27960 [Streptomyces phaeochromogenes]|uniref:hypothetical protein n=1 Tax=Streptomyces phaeochromogenes TaxID=1923 RepID=UPI0033F33093
MSVLANEAYDTIVTAEQVTGEELQTLINRGGRDSGPGLLHAAYTARKITADAVAQIIGGVWSMADRPDRELERDEWRTLFDAAGFTVDGERKPRPDKPMTLFRGSVPERRTDWSWTYSIAIAAKYAGGKVPGRAVGKLWVCEVPPEAMLAINTERGEDEIVVDTRGLNIREALR